jgi:hypothetical protein
MSMPMSEARPVAALLTVHPVVDNDHVSVLSALIGALMEPERYSIVSRDGELFIKPSRWRAHRFAKWRKWRPTQQSAIGLASLSSP